MSSPCHPPLTILSPNDLHSYFPPSALKHNSSFSSLYNRSQCQLSGSPTSQSSKDDDRSQNEIVSYGFNEESIRLRQGSERERERERVKYEQLVNEMSLLGNEMHVKEMLVKELENEKAKFVEEMHYIRVNHEKLQEEKNRLLNETAHLRTLLNSTRARLDVNEDQIATLEHENRKLIDELNFEKEMLADYKSENLVFKGQLKNVKLMMEALRDGLNKDKDRQLEKFRVEVEGKLVGLKDGLEGCWAELKKIGSEQRLIAGCKEENFAYIKTLQSSFQGILTELNTYRNKSTYSEIEQSARLLLLKREQQYRKAIHNNEQKIKSLAQQVASLKKTNLQLSDQLSQYSSVRLLAPRFHTNSSYIDKIVKQNSREIQQIKQIILMKDDQIQRLRNQLELEQSGSQAKSEEIERLQIAMKASENNKNVEFTIQVSDLNAEKVRLTRRVDQLVQVQQNMKAQIAEKDRIIMNYVQKAKIAKNS